MLDSGVIQGDTLAPMLFNLVLDFVITRLQSVNGCRSRLSAGHLQAGGVLEDT